MGKRNYPVHLIKYWYAYDIEDLCHLYKTYGLHPQTVRSWIRQGLPTIDGGKPVLIYGNDLKEFLSAASQSHKCKTRFEQLFCFKCQTGKSPHKKHVQLEYTNGFVKAKAKCQTCKTTMNKSYKQADLSRIKSVFTVVDSLELYDSSLVEL